MHSVRKQYNGFPCAKNSCRASRHSCGGANPGEEFIILDADPVADERLLQDSIFAKLHRSTFLVAFNKDGYLGKAAVLEIGYAISQGVQILTLEEVEDPNIRPYTRKITDVFPDALALWPERKAA